MGEFLLLVEVHRVDKALLVWRVEACGAGHGPGGAGSLPGPHGESLCLFVALSL